MKSRTHKTKRCFLPSRLVPHLVSDYPCAFIHTCSVCIKSVVTFLCVPFLVQEAGAGRVIAPHQNEPCILNQPQTLLNYLREQSLEI